MKLTPIAGAHHRGTGKARACARTIAGWTPLPDQPPPVTRLHPRKDG